MKQSNLSTLFKKNYCTIFVQFFMLITVAVLLSCGKGNNPVTEPVTQTVTPPTDSNNSGGNNGGSAGKWTIIPLIRTYNGGTEYIKTENGKYVYNETNFTNGDQQRFHATATGTSETEWINVTNASLAHLSAFTYEVTIPNAIDREATFADTTGNYAFRRTRVADAANKKMTIYYTFKKGKFGLVNDSGFSGTINFNDVTKSNKAKVLSY